MKKQLDEHQTETVNGGARSNATGTFVLRAPEEEEAPAPELTVWERLWAFFGFRTK